MCFFPSYGVTPSPVSNNVLLILQKQVQMVRKLFLIAFYSFFTLNFCNSSLYFSYAYHTLPCVICILAAAAAAKSLQSCLTLCDPIDCSPPGSPVPGILQARTLEWVAISFSNAWKWKVKVKSLNRIRLLATPWTAAYQAPPSMGFSRQEYWSGVPLPLLLAWLNMMASFMSGYGRDDCKIHQNLTLHSEFSKGPKHSALLINSWC